MAGVAVGVNGMKQATVMEMEAARFIVRRQPHYGCSDSRAAEQTSGQERNTSAPADGLERNI